MIRALRPHITETMLETAELNRTTLLWWMLMFMVTGRILGTLEGEDGISSCEPGMAVSSHLHSLHKSLMPRATVQQGSTVVTFTGNLML